MKRMLEGMPRSEHEPEDASSIDLRDGAQATGLRLAQAVARLRDLSLECLWCGTQHGDQKAVLACEEGHYWDVVAGLAERERGKHLRAALEAARRRGELSPRVALMFAGRWAETPTSRAAIRV